MARPTLRDVAHPRSGLRPLPLKGATLADRQSRIRGVCSDVLRSLLVVAFFAAAALGASAKEAAPAVEDPALEARMQAIAVELRCLVCQNQTIADSSADLAVDLRNQVKQMLREGKSQREIIDYMTARYGDFVLYRPPVKGTTMLLWYGPALALLAGLAALVVTLRRRSRRAPEDFDADEPELLAADDPTPPATAR
jgi:cytochrome c-type biogenesis protein CcmH